MQPAVLTTVLVVAAAVELSAQNPFPGGRLYRGPLYMTRPATVIYPDRPTPVEFQKATFTWRGTPTLQANAVGRTLVSFPVSGITIRVAFGPTGAGMITFRMRPRAGDALDSGSARIIPNAPPMPLTFELAAEDPPPGPLALGGSMRIVFTLERVENNEGPLLFENPDATELLWQALGRPTFSTQ